MKTIIRLVNEGGDRKVVIEVVELVSEETLASKDTVAIFDGDVRVISSPRPPQSEADKPASEGERIAEQARELRYWKDEAGRLLKECQDHRAKAAGNYWSWQGDGGDYLESLTCPVLIRADMLRSALAAAVERERERCAKLVESLRFHERAEMLAARIRAASASWSRENVKG